MANVDLDAKPKELAEVVQWQNRIAAARRQERDFLKEGKEICRIYEDSKGNPGEPTVPYNILYSNTETLAPALYNNLPRPVVERRFKDDDPVGKASSEVLKRMLSFLLDTNSRDYAEPDFLFRRAVLEALLPGWGNVRFKYDAEVEEVPDAEGTPQPSRVLYETVCGETVRWNRVVLGYADCWKEVPWIAFEHFMTKAEFKENFPKADISKIPFNVTGGTEDSQSAGDSDDPKKAEKQGSGEQLAHVFEIWDRQSRKICVIASGCDSWIENRPDDLQLEGFWPMPEPMRLFQKITNLIPTPLYKLYREQAEELNVVTVRITKIVKAMKVRGFYDQTLGGIEELLKKEDGTLLPAQNVGAMLQGQTLEKAIWLMPIEKLVSVLQQLLLQRGQIKQVIYEITGVSDILRGSSVASETATAQEIKNQWGTLRLKRMQKEVMRYVRDSLRIMAEIGVTKLSQETIIAMTGLKYPTAAEKQQMQLAMQQMQIAGQQPDPRLQETLAIPTWEEILTLLKDDVQRNYRIDIETNSTVDADATEDKQDVAEVMNAIAQFMNGVQPMLEAGYMSFDVAKSLLLATIRRFRFGVEIEDQIKNMQPPPPKQEGQEEAQKQQLEMQKAQQEMAAEQARQQQEMQMQQAENAAKLEQMRLDAELRREEADLRRAEMAMQLEIARAEHQMKMEQIAAQALASKQAAADKANATKGEPNANL